MASVNDPFLWGVDDVVEALCAAGKPWVHDAAALESRIREEELDGEALLTYEKMFSRKELLGLLHIKTARRQGLLTRELVSLRNSSRSPAYRAWLTAYNKDVSLESDDSETNIRTDTIVDTALAKENVRISHSTGEPKANGAINRIDHQGHETSSGILDPDRSVAVVNVDSTPTPDSLRDSRLIKQTPPPISSKQPETAERPQKQRRIQTELVAGGDSAKYKWEYQPRGTYIGLGSISESDILSSDVKLSSWLTGELSDDEFLYLPRKRLPPGRQLAVNRMTQRLLRKGAGSAAERQAELQELITAEEQASFETDLQPVDDDHSVVTSLDIPSDEERELERQIAAEKEDERQELEAHKKRHALLTKDQVRALINGEIARVTSEWKERKIPKLRRKAYSIWSASRRRGTKARDVLDAWTKAQSCHQRLQRMMAEILQLDHENEKDVRRSAESLEATVEDKLYHFWVASTLESNEQPPRPETIPRPKRTAPRKAVNDDPELILSSDEEDFIVPDEENSVEAPADSDMANEDLGGVDVGNDVDMADAVQDIPAEELAAPTFDESDNQVQVLEANQEMPDIENQPVHDEERAEITDEPPRTPGRTHARGMLVKEEPQQPAPRQRKTPPETIDLTTPAKPVDASQTDHPTTSTKPSGASQKKGRSLFEDIGELSPSLDELADEGLNEITKYGARHWAQLADRHRLVICMLKSLDFEPRSAIYKSLKANTPDMVWKTSVLAYLKEPPKKLEDLKKGQPTTDFEITRIFCSYLRRKHIVPKKLVDPSDRTKTKVRENETPNFANFCKFVISMEPLFPEESQIYRLDLSDDEFEDDYARAARDDDSQEDAGTSQRSQAQARKGKLKEIIRDKDAVDLRLQEQQRRKDQESRRLKLRNNLAMTGSVSRDKSRLIINESKDDEQSLLYINEGIGKSIKEHQIEGIRFFWNQIITDPETRQGCLLSHTMGLGKTMQVITFLVAIAEASSSEDDSLRQQIPKDLRNSQTLILCPAGLVNNWMDELLRWAPEDSLGELFQVDAQAAPELRLDSIDTWASYGGVLVMGYTLFQQMSQKAPIGDQRVNKDDHAAIIAKRLLETPNIVVADEAHTMKKADGKLNLACHKLRTTTRLALTGSPLANHVGEYYSMINWVAPNFLGPLQEFNQIYVSVIEAGLAKDSLPYEKRSASKMLQVLKETVDPKVHRATTKTPSLAKDLPEKKEFMISVPPTPLQEELYRVYIDALGIKPTLMSLVYDLGLICAHPRCFRKKTLEVKNGLEQPNPKAYPSFPEQIIGDVLARTTGSEKRHPLHSNKVQFLVTILDEAREIGDKVLVFSQSLQTLDYLENLLESVQKRKVCRLDGSSNVGDRQEEVKKFNTGSQEIYLISTRAGGVGLNIHGANRVVLFDTGWNPVHEQQAVGRAYRLGQRKPVFVYHLKVAGSFEEGLQDQAIFKTQLAQRVIDKKNPIPWGKRNGQYNTHLKPVKNMDISALEHKDCILDRLIKDPPGKCRITKILLTDTLEEEDPTSALTQEERAEATKIVKMNELRHTNPAEWEKQKAEFNRQEAAQQWAHTLASGGLSGVATPRNGHSPYPVTPVPLPQQPARSSLGSGAVPLSQDPDATPSIPGLSNYGQEHAHLRGAPLSEPTTDAPPPQTPDGISQTIKPQASENVQSEPQHQPPSQTSGSAPNDGQPQTLTDIERPSSDGTPPRV